ncbi:imidazolonepropionase [Vibrio sp. 404]|uniref:Imidazolonepropionase n=1 Tax=Vibrio marinisediminis TaxID=2758441 RepID=A0A7W2FRT9_9VIBR|nr:imidazolonepropionase [Vibrio marinisediminis]MBA5763002.1 imidazolonepropionase [Vibrio marinisediminis]
MNDTGRTNDSASAKYDFLLENARLVTMVPGTNGYQVLDAHLYLRDGKIAAISQHRLDTSVTDVLDCQGKLVTPGFIDSHTHLIYAGNRANEFEMRLNGVPYQTIAQQGGGILATVKATRLASQQQLTEQALLRLDGLINSGVTSVEIKSGYGLTLSDELKMLRAAKALENHRQIRVSTTLLAAHAVPPEFKNQAERYIDLVCEEIIPAAASESLADSVDVFCESIGFSTAQTERVFQAAQQHGLAVKGHTEQLSNLGGSALTARYNGLSADHIEYLDEAGVIAMANSGTVANLLPGAFYFLRETQKPPIELLRQYKVPMAIASDINPGTSPFADLTMMMNMGCTLFNLTPEETLRGVTCHAASALGVGNNRGQIEIGFDADLAIWDVEHPAEFSYLQGVKRLYARLIQGAVSYA